MTSRDHKAMLMPLKLIEVDHGILPIILWLNSFRGIFTLWSCEGDYLANGEKDPYKGTAYVVFTGFDKDSYDVIRQTLIGFIEDDIEIDHYEGLIRYTFSFPTKWHRDAVIDLLKSEFFQKTPSGGI